MMGGLMSQLTEQRGQLKEQENCKVKAHKQWKLPGSREEKERRKSINKVPIIMQSFASSNTTKMNSSLL